MTEMQVPTFFQADQGCFPRLIQTGSFRESGLIQKAGKKTVPPKKPVDTERSMALNPARLENLLCERLRTEILIHKRNDNLLMLESPFLTEIIFQFSIPRLQPVLCRTAILDIH